MPVYLFLLWLTSALHTLDGFFVSLSLSLSHTEQQGKTKMMSRKNSKRNARRRIRKESSFSSRVVVVVLCWLHCKRAIQERRIAHERKRGEKTRENKKRRRLDIKNTNKHPAHISRERTRISRRKERERESERGKNEISRTYRYVFNPSRG